MSALEGVRRILVIRRRGLGDALVSLRAVLELGAAAPEASVDLLIDRPFAPLFEGAVAPDRLLRWPRDDADGSAGWWTVLRGSGYDLVVDLLSTPRTALWTALTGARLRVGYDLIGRRWAYNVRVARNRHGGRGLKQFAGESFLDPLRALGLTPAPWNAAELPAADESLLDESYLRWRDDRLAEGRRRVALVLSAGWPAKAWPAEEAARLVEVLAESGVETVFCPGPGDERLTVEAVATSPRLTVAPPTGLRELADLLRRCACYVGTDGGARHVAVAVGRPTVTLFGPTDPAGWNQEHPDHVSLRTGEPCSPCDLRECPVAGHPCMTGLDGAAVARTVNLLLARTGSRVHDGVQGGER